MSDNINKSDWLLIILLAIVAATATIKVKELATIKEVEQWTSQGR